MDRSMHERSHQASCRGTKVQRASFTTVERLRSGRASSNLYVVSDTAISAREISASFTSSEKGDT